MVEGYCQCKKCECNQRPLPWWVADPQKKRLCTLCTNGMHSDKEKKAK